MTPQQYAIALVAILALWILAIWVMSRVYEHRSIPAVQDFLGGVLFAVDEECDHLEVPAKKAEAVRQILDLLGWRRIIVPAALVSWCLTFLVWLTRRTHVPDLHKDEQDGPPGGPR